jgi:hypothetical protein
VDDRVATVKCHAKLATPRAVDALEPKASMFEQAPEVRQRSAREIVDTDDLQSLSHEPIAEM